MDIAGPSAVDSIDRCAAASGTEIHVALLKTIALIDLFRERSGLSSAIELLASYAPQKYGKKQVDEALTQLVSESFVMFRKHLGAYALYAGSDFDIDEAFSAAFPDAKQV